ncbi:hypothetical protein EMIHUDRAFT_49568, partial [Emiliania huxleyi CCMP1516]|uniref:Uncharacterized protein n=2 Tax=Emiliania huxleyi TaxID=2903 RepID=A0A0D3J9R0_EMIH1
CICINCKWVDRCKTYHWVETQHEQEHVTAAPDFEPVDPQIQAAVAGEMLRDLTTEFDVFACDAFTEDSGRWLRLMPD